LAYHDYLTDSPSALLLHDRLAQAVAVANRQQQQLAVLFVNVERFKYINDSQGHVIGDQMLLSVAGPLVATVRSFDIVSREGGDEFVILRPTIAQPEDAALSCVR
jgi:diguanylate cyclase (GGDEF)-like protein